MLEYQFILINSHFIINLFAALVCFSVCWLYFDTWLSEKTRNEGAMALGFFLISFSFVIQAATLDQSIISDSILGIQRLSSAAFILRASGYITLIIGQIIYPLQPLPSYRSGSAALIAGLAFSEISLFTLPILATATAFLYLRRATKGLEHHLKPISLSLYVFSVMEIFSISSVFRGTANIDLEQQVRAFGNIWLAEHLLLLAAVFILGHWIWGYLVKRFEVQLFMIFTAMGLSAFLLTAVFFTTVTIINTRQDILKNLEVSASVLEFSIESKKAETLSDTQVIAQNQDIINALEDRDRNSLNEITQQRLLTKNQSFLSIVDDSGEIISRADDPEKAGGSLSGDSLVSEALAGKESTGIVTTEGVLSPNVSVRAAVPVYKGSDLLGAVVVGTTIDDAFVDSLKETTGLDASIYGNNVRSATTFIAGDGTSRYTGIKEETEEVKNKVLAKGETYTGDVNILNTPYLAAFSPLLDNKGKAIGMLFVGRPQTDTINTAANLIEQTFLVTVALLIISVLPSYLISRYIINQVKV